MAHWYDDPVLVRRVHRHARWFYLNENSVADGIKPPAKLPSATQSKVSDETKAIVKDIKYLLGYLKIFQLWGRGVDQRFIDRIHHPTLVGPRATKRGIARRKARRGPAPGSLAEKAQRLLDHPRASFGFVSPTGGSAAVGLRQIAAGEKAYVASPEAGDTGHYVYINEDLIDFLLELCDKAAGPIWITCIVNGDHSSDSEHYLGIAVDVGKNGNYRNLYAIAAKHGLTVLDEDSVHYHVHK